MMTSAVEGLNRLRIDLESTIRYAYANEANYTKDVAEDYFWENEWITQAEVEQARTQAQDFGWDWSLAAAPQGLFGEVKLYFD